MAFLGQKFDLDDLPEGSSGDFKLLPDGWYNAIIASAEVRTTKAGTGQYIAVRYDITGPTHEGRVVFGNLNISNPNEKAEEIGRKQLGQLMAAIGLRSVQDSDELVGGQCSIKLTTRRSEEYGDSNEVQSWKSATGSAPPAPSASKPSPAASGGSKKAPWAK